MRAIYGLEIRSLLRDRRTVFVSIVLPVILMPLLLLVSARVEQGRQQRERTRGRRQHTLFWIKVIVGRLILMVAIPALFVWLSNKGPIADVVAATFKDRFERGIIAGISVGSSVDWLSIWCTERRRRQVAHGFPIRRAVSATLGHVANQRHHRPTARRRMSAVTHHTQPRDSLREKNSDPRHLVRQALCGERIGSRGGPGVAGREPTNGHCRCRARREKAMSPRPASSDISYSHRMSSDRTRPEESR